MRNRMLAFLVAGLLPLAACEADAGEDLGDDIGVEEGLETEPATEMVTPTAATNGFGAWDTDANQELTREEWGGWYEDEGFHDTWNTDAEEGLTQDEFGQGVFEAWDVNDDEGLTEDEWTGGVTTWYGDADYGAFGEWDANNDSILDANEVAEGLETRNLYDRVDRDSDALIDDEELADWWFDLWDGNDDDVIDTTEWDQVGAEWSRMGFGTGAGM